jgi:hypothetical protein
MASEAAPLTTEDQMFDLIDKACGKGGRPVPFRGAYHLTQEQYKYSTGFGLRRRGKNTSDLLDHQAPECLGNLLTDCLRCQSPFKATTLLLG